MIRTPGRSRSEQHSRTFSSQTQPSTLNAQHSTLNTQHSTLNPEPQTQPGDSGESDDDRAAQALSLLQVWSLFTTILSLLQVSLDYSSLFTTGSLFTTSSLYQKLSTGSLLTKSSLTSSLYHTLSLHYRSLLPVCVHTSPKHFTVT